MAHTFGVPTKTVIRRIKAMETDELRFKQRGEIREIVHLFDQGWTDEELCVRFECLRNTVQRARKGKTQKRAFSDAVKREVVDLYVNHKWEYLDIENETGGSRNTQKRFIRAAGFELRGYAKNTFRGKVHRSTRLSVYQNRRNDMDTLYLVHFDFLQDGKPKVKLGRTLYSVQQRFNPEPYPWREVQIWRSPHRYIAVIEYETKQAFAKYMRPGPESFKGRFECFPVDLTSRLAQHMENAIQATLIPEGHDQRLESDLKQGAVKQIEVQTNPKQNKICSHVVPMDEFESKELDSNLEISNPKVNLLEEPGESSGKKKNKKAKPSTLSNKDMRQGFPPPSLSLHERWLNFQLSRESKEQAQT